MRTEDATPPDGTSTGAPAPAGNGHDLALAVACPNLAAKLAGRFGGAVSVRGAGDPAAAIALCGIESFVGRGAPDRSTSHLLVVVARAPGETLEAALLAGGADEVIDEGRSDALILARLHALARRHRRSHAARVRCGRWLIDFELSEARGEDGRMRLTRLEARLLRFLTTNDGAPASAPVLLARVFGYGDRVETHTLETHVYRLRQKLERDPHRPRLLLRDTEGYRLALGGDALAPGGDAATDAGPIASTGPIAAVGAQSGAAVTGRPAATGSGASARQPCARP